MSDEYDEDQSVDMESEPEIDEPVPKKKRAISEDAKAKRLENLAAARKAKIEKLKAAPNLVKYPKGARASAEERYKMDLAREADRLAELKAEKLLEEKERMRELQELREYKKRMEKQEKLSKQDEKTEDDAPVKKKPAKKVATTSSKKKDTVPKAKAKPKAKKPTKVASDDDYGDYGHNSRGGYDPYAGLF